MAASMISQLGAVASVAGTNELGLNESGTSKKANVDQLSTYFFAAASDTVAGKIEIADQSEQESGSDNTKAVTSGRQHFHPSAAKFWIQANGTSTVMQSSYNMTSWAHTGTGDADGTIATDFSDANWCGISSIQVPALRMSACTSALNSQCASVGFNSQAAGTFGVLCSRNTGNGTAVVDQIDPDWYFAVGYGDFA